MNIESKKLLRKRCLPESFGDESIVEEDDTVQENTDSDLEDDPVTGELFVKLTIVLEELLGEWRKISTLLEQLTLRFLA